MYCRPARTRCWLSGVVGGGVRRPNEGVRGDKEAMDDAPSSSVSGGVMKYACISSSVAQVYPGTEVGLSVP